MSGGYRPSDVVVIGGGPAGLAAARAATDAGKRVLLLDQGAQLGGQLWHHRRGDPLPARATALLAAVQPPRVAIAHRAVVLDAPDPRHLIVSFNGRMAIVETAAVVLATGAVERFLPFPGWTLPGVVGVGAMQSLCKEGLSVTGASVVIAGAGPLALPVAALLASRGAHVEWIAEQASAAALRRFAWHALRSPRRLVQAAGLRWSTRASPYRTDAWVVRAEGTDRVEQVVLNIQGTERTVPCHWLATAAGLVPRTELARLLGCVLRGDAIRVDERQETSVGGVYAAGETVGIGGEDAAIVTGTIAGLAAAGVRVVPASLRRAQARAIKFARVLQRSFAPRDELLARVTSDTLVCRCEDVAAGALRPEWSQRQAKLWTRIGMGACQGTVCGPACEALFGWGPNASRPPLGMPAAGAFARVLGELTPSETATPPA